MILIEAFYERGNKWVDYKKKYLDYFISLKKKWEMTKNKKYYFNVEKLFRKKSYE